MSIINQAIRDLVKKAISDNTVMVSLNHIRNKKSTCPVFFLTCNNKVDL